GKGELPGARRALRRTVLLAGSVFDAALQDRSAPPQFEGDRFDGLGHQGWAVFAHDISGLSAARRAASLSRTIGSDQAPGPPSMPRGWPCASWTGRPDVGASSRAAPCSANSAATAGLAAGGIVLMST